MTQQQVLAGQQHTVVGRVASLDQARRVSQYLQHHGVDARDVHLSGSGSDQLRPEPPTVLTRDARGQIDGLAVGQRGRKGEAGALIGALAGAAIGMGGGLLATAGNVGRDLSVFLAIVFVFTGLGAWVAACLTAATAVGRPDPAPRPIDETADGATWLTVRVRDDRDATHTRVLLAREGVMLVEDRTAVALGVHTNGW